MTNRIMLLLVILVFLLAPPVSAAEVEEGIVEGYVLNKTQGNSVANLEVRLSTYMNNQVVKSFTTNTGIDGYFVFKGLLTGISYQHLVMVNYQGVEYSSEELTLKSDGLIKRITLPVYNTTDDDKVVRVEQAHVIIYIEPEGLLVKEYLVFSNDSTLTYVGSRNTADGTMKTLRFILPEQVDEIEITQGLHDCCIVASEDGFYDTDPLSPEGREVIYSYRIKPDASTYVFKHKVNYPIGHLILLVQTDNVKVINPQLLSNEVIDIEGKKFTSFTGDDIESGITISIELLDVSGGRRIHGAWVLTIWLLVILTVFLLIFMLRKKKLTTLKAKTGVEAQYQQGITELAQMDNNFADGKLEEDTYIKLRAAKKSHIVKLQRKMQGKYGSES